MTITTSFIYVHLLVFVQLPNSQGCNPILHSHDTAYSVAVMSCVIFLETLLLGLLLYRKIRVFRHDNSPLIRTLYKDGIIFYFCTLALSVGNVVVMTSFPPGLRSILDIPYCTLHSALACRVVLHLRATDSDNYNTLNTPTLNMPSRPIQFANAARRYRNNQSFLSAGGVVSVVDRT